MVSSSPFFDNSGNFTGAIHIAKDVTEHKMLEAQLRQAQKMEAIGTLAGGIAHDFNNILGAVLGYTELAFMSSSESLVRDNLKEVKKAGSRAKELVGQILTFSRQRETMRKPVLVSPIIKEAHKLLRASLPTTIELNLNLVTENSKIMADPTQVHQVLMNLCTNAFHAMKGHTGMVEVTLEEVDLASEMITRYQTIGAGAYVKLSVRDTGCGIEPIIIDRIFEPFFTTKPVGDGTGMGLSVVHGIVKSYGGAITVDSKPGKGSTFNVFLPRIDAPQDEEGRDIAVMPSPGSERILFVDDEETLTKMGERMLRYLGYDVVALTSSAAALEIFRESPARFDLVITDYTMPDLTGLELAKSMLALRPGLPIVICTGFSEDVTEEMAKAAGVRELVMKPLAIHDLAEVIRSVLDQT
ncbi:MAG: response regulator [Proteobacteria bacterium]|nr:response regulator [Pseudomonadota bacterium]MBU1714500.1 response regulator [Pseudomonadota bacterium]